MLKSSYGALCTLLGCAALACAGGSGTPIAEMEKQLKQSERELATLQESVRERERALERSQSQVESLERELQDARLPAVSAASPALARGDLLPPATAPGQCFARVFEPPTYETGAETVLKRAASERIEVIPARYEWVEERVLVKEAHEKLEVVPATYEWREERVMVKPAHTVWKKGRGPIERIDDATGEIMCLVEVPAEYKTVRTRVVKTPETTSKITVPAEYTTVKVRKLVEPEKERRIEIPAEYETVTKRRQVTEGRMAWRPVLCETNATRTTVRSIQQALKASGYDPGAIDGVIGNQTLSAVKSYQQAKGLATGGLTYATIASLGVTVGR